MKHVYTYIVLILTYAVLSIITDRYLVFTRTVNWRWFIRDLVPFFYGIVLVHINK